MEAPRRLGRTVKISTASDVLVESSACGNGTHIDLASNIRETLLQMCCKDSITTSKPHVGSVLNIVSKHIEKKGCNTIGLDILDLFTCLRIALINDSKAVRAAALRVIRLCLQNEESAKKLVQADLHHFIAKCLDVLVDNMAERAQALRLCRRLLMIDPLFFPVALARSIVALAFDGTKEKDRLVRASLAILAELCIVNPSVFVASGGVRCFSSAILDCSSARMQEAMVASLLYLFDTEQRRGLSKLNLRFLVAPYSDFHYRHHIDPGETNNASTTTDDRELRLLCAKQALLTVLRSWNGVLHIMSCKILEDLVQVLLPCHLETRKSMLEFFYTLLRLPLPEWTDEFTVALQATDPSRVQDAWKLQEGYVALEGKCLLPHISKFRPNLVLNHMALLVYCLVEAKLVQTLVEVIVTSDTFISVRATILLGELLHLGSTLLPPSCHGTKMCLPQLVDCITSLKGDPLKRHRAAQAAEALSKIHQLKKKGIVPHSLALKQIVELERRACASVKSNSRRSKKTEDTSPAANISREESDFKTNGEPETELHSTKIQSSQIQSTQIRPSRDPDGILSALSRDCGVLAQKDPLIWNWSVLTNLFMWSKMNPSALEDSSLRSIIRRVISFYKPSSNQFCQCEFNNSRTRLYSVVGCYLMDALTVIEEMECEKILAEFLDDISCAIRDITLAPSAHDCLFSPGRLAGTACQDYFLFIGRLSSTTNGTIALEKAGLFQDLLELVASISHDCYLKVIVSTLDFHTDGYTRAILKKILLGPVESGRIYATHHIRVLLRAAEEYGSTSTLAKWTIPLLLNQLNDKCRAVVVAAADILDETTDDSASIEVLIPLQAQFVQLIKDQEKQHLDSRARLLMIKTLSIPAGFKDWLETVVESDKGKLPLVQLELDLWMTHLNVRYVQLVESDLADGLTQHQRAEDGRFGRLSNVRHAIRDLPVPPHLFSQLNQHREGLDFLRTSDQLSKLFTVVINGSIDTEQEILELKAAVWACAHLGTSESGVALLESAQVVEALVRVASLSSVLALRGTAFFALNLIAMTTAGVDILARLGWASIKRHHGELWHVVDDSEWNCFYLQLVDDQHVVKDNNRLDVRRDRLRTVSQSSCHSVTFAADERGDIIASSVVTSTPRRDATGLAGQTTGCWETDSQPYSIEGSSINFDSDSDQSSESPANIGPDRTCRRAYTLPLSVQTPGQEYVPHFRSFSDSHYPTTDEASNGVPTSPTSRPKRESRIWNRLRTSLRLRKSKRFSLPVGTSKESPFKPPEIAPIHLLRSEPMIDGASGSAEETLSSSAAEEASSEDEDHMKIDSTPLHFEFQLNRIGSILSRLKSVPYKTRPFSSSTSRSSGSFIGLCLPVQLSYLHPPSDWFESPPDLLSTTISSDIANVTLNEEPQVEHDSEHCIICSRNRLIVTQTESKQTEEEKWLVRKELLRLVTNMGSSVGLNANEQGLLRLKQRFPWAFHDVCLFSDVCHILASYGYRLRARRFLHELFMDSPFDELYAVAASRLKTSSEPCPS